jgi:hypothetical protein
MDKHPNKPSKDTIKMIFRQIDHRFIPANGSHEPLSLYSNGFKISF